MGGASWKRSAGSRSTSRVTQLTTYIERCENGRGKGGYEMCTRLDETFCGAAVKQLGSTKLLSLIIQICVSYRHGEVDNRFLDRLFICRVYGGGICFDTCDWNDIWEEVVEEAKWSAQGEAVPNLRDWVSGGARF